MKILLTSYSSSSAFLLGRDGSTVSVDCHPILPEESDTAITYILYYGDEEHRKLAEDYQNNPTEELYAALISYYENNWCKVRDWGDLTQTDLTFRITSYDKFNWYGVIIDFLLSRKWRSNTVITVERMKPTHKVYWDSITYAEAVDPANETILATRLIKR
ncbi:MAG: hypothetical protein J5725_06410 [Bacteroidales bacterium]|nr:hypothetical protein [Bacteroidales bacterium]